MKYLDARKAGGKPVTPSVREQNKMQSGSRLDQRDPESLISSFSRARTREENKATQHTQPTTKPHIVQMAERLGVDLATVQGSGTHGEILMKDVKAAHEDALEQQRAKDESHDESTDEE
jgi:pyruvate/2-oxoglutarate dehydrogenase complex dihydrolipoamide acyltransferase (E2) component